MYKINEFSQKTGFSKRMLRYLDEMGLLKPSRAENDYRYYLDGDLQRALRIRFFQSLGFSLKETASLLELEPARVEAQLKRLQAEKQKEAAALAQQSTHILQALQLLQSQPGETKMQELLQTVTADPLRLEDRSSLLEELDLTERVVRGPVLEMDSICGNWIPDLNSLSEFVFKVNSFDLYKYGKWTHTAPLGKFHVFEVPVLFSHFLVAIPEVTEILLGSEITAARFMASFAHAWQQTFPPIHPVSKGHFSNPAKVLEIAGYHDVMICMRLQVVREEDHADLYLILPYSPIHVLKTKH